MVNLKHIGRVKSTGRRCLVVFRTLPGDAFSCLIVQTESLSPTYHDQLISLVESPAAQNANEFSEVLARAVFSDGSTMLPSLHVKGMLAKFATDQIEMLPNMQTTLLLSELNQIIAEQQGMSVQDLAIQPEHKSSVEIKEIAEVKDISPKLPEAVKDEAVVNFATPDDEAKFYRSQADKLAKEAAAMRRKAEELSPTKKKVTVKE
jgi:hypothetical protein